VSRAQRLLELLEELRRHRAPVAGAQLAERLGISLRTLYRDIASLQEQGARIEGEAGLGYVLRPGFLLPPLMFSAEEIQALVLGSRWVVERGDGQLSAAAQSALDRICAVLPKELRDDADESPLLVGPAPSALVGDGHLPALRRAIREEEKVELLYRSGPPASGAAPPGLGAAADAPEETRRTVWPFALGFFERSRVLIAWCELRTGFRHFRLDRIAALAPLAERYPRRRLELLRDWRGQEQGR
jgi:predicted DNA-binding transcriptional regulator YafY